MSLRFSLRLTSFFVLASWLCLSAQEKPPQDWFHLDPEKDGYPGISTERSYSELLSNSKGETIIVAVLDSGVDAEHEDLKDVMWVNEDEIPGNGIDDDKNGYIDDIHGWNFIGNKDGTNVHHDNLEVTRLFVKYDQKFKGKDPASLSAKEKKEYDQYKEYEKVVTEKREEVQQNAVLYGAVVEAVRAVKKELGKEEGEITLEDLTNYQSDNMLLGQTAKMMIDWMSNGESFAEIDKQLEETFEYFYNRHEYYYNPEFNSRNLVGDNYKDPYEKNYGNNDVEGPDADHGTHVAGIIAATRNNNYGMNGVASNVRIMSVRTVPDGDERDKDVANAIIYAVDNGAKIINMSFGKGASPYKEAVDKAVKYALKKDVLLVHAAGNDGKENTISNNFPNDKFTKKGLFGPKYAANWIEVGATNWVRGQELTAGFSNYSADLVDVFAPGVDIYSTTPDDTYTNHQGTSMAAPVVAGAAAVLRSYFPSLSAKEVKEVLMSSVVKYKFKVNKPGSEEQVGFNQLSVSGGVINLYDAIRLAQMKTGKKSGGNATASVASK